MVFAMTRQEAQATPDVVTSVLSIFDHDAYILIDPRSTHSYLSSAFFMHANKRLSWLDHSLVVSMLVGKQFAIDQVYKDCLV